MGSNLGIYNSQETDKKLSNLGIYNSQETDKKL